MRMPASVSISRHVPVSGLSCRHEIRTIREARTLAHDLSGFFPGPEAVLLGIHELLLNAIEHGNLEIGYARKGALLRAGKLEQEILRRQEMPRYVNRKVRVSVEHMPEAVRLLVSDEGRGFAWRDYLALSQERAGDPHGRGIALAAELSFDRLYYLGGGRIACAEVTTN